MRKQIRLTESDLHRIVKESVDKILNEGFWDNMGSAIRGAYNGYNANVSRQNQDNHDTKSIAVQVNNLYNLVGDFASDFKKNGNGLYNARSYQKIEAIKKCVNYIESAFMKSQSYQNRVNRASQERQNLDDF